MSFYALGRDEILSKTPIKKLGVDSCVNVICFHPAIAFIVAVGLYSGVFINIVLFVIELGYSFDTLKVIRLIFTCYFGLRVNMWLIDYYDDFILL